MEFIIDIKFNDKHYNAVIHFVSLLKIPDEKSAQKFFEELIEGFRRNNILILSKTYLRIDNNTELRESQYQYHQFCMKRATASILVEQFVIEKPDQSKSLADNMVEKFFSGEKSTAKIIGRYNVPVRVIDTETKNLITDDFYYTVEQLVAR